MRFPPTRRQEVLRVLLADPDTHVNFDPSVYREDGNIVVTVDGITMFLHRWLYRELETFTLPDDVYLLPSCDVRGCQNPWHRTVSTAPGGEGVAPRKLKGGPSGGELNAAKTECVHHHPFTPENTYHWTDKDGRRHRKCKQCTLDLNKLRRKKS